jgi:Prenyltransferase and squalene oxidase repeat
MNPDGGFPATPGQDSSAEMTGWAMLGLESAGINPRDLGRAGRSPVDFLRRNIGETSSPGDLARTILALRGAGIDPRHFAGRDLAAKLAGRRRPNGSYVGWPGSTAFAVMALRASGLRAGLARSLAGLRQVQSAEGGWGAVPAGHSDPDTTGAVLQALAGGSRATTRGLRYLRRTQRPGGGWALAESGPTNSQSTAWAIQGLLAAGIKPSSVKRGGRNGLEYLAARQARDGHYRYSSSSDQTPVWVTAQALVAAQRKPFPLAPVPQMPGSGGGRAGGGEAGASGSHSESGGEGAGVNGSGKGGAGEGAPHPSLTRHSRERREQSAAGSPARSDAKRSGGASPPPATARDQLNSATATLAADKPQGGSDDGGTSSLLAPVAIAVAAAAAVLACGWGAARRLRA